MVTKHSPSLTFKSFSSADSRAEHTGSDPVATTTTTDHNLCQFRINRGAIGAAFDFQSPTSDDLKAEYNSIQESLSRVQLPGEIIVNKTTQGVGKDQKAAHKVVTTSAKYTETALKLALQLHKEKVGKEGLEQLIVALFAQLKYLQDEGAALIVSSTFDPSVSKFFRTFQKNNSQFPPETSEILSKAVTIGAAQAQSQGHKGGNR